MSDLDRNRLLNNPKVNNSDKSRGILPATGAHADFPEQQGFFQKYKWWVIGGAVVLILALVLGLTLGGGGGGDNPVPPAPPIVYNPYSVDPATLVSQVYMVKGVLKASASKLEELNAQPFTKLNDNLIKADPRMVPTGKNNEVIKNLAFEFGQADWKVAYMRLTDNDNARFSPPKNIVNQLNADGNKRLDQCGFELLQNPFGFKFMDTKNPSNAIISTENSAFIFMDKYIQMDLQLPSRRIYGLGERNTQFALGEGTWTMWANGQETPIDDGTGGKQTYGVHPFALIQTANKGEYFGLFFRNTNAMSPVITFTGDSTSTLSYITTGGQLEIYFMFKGTPKEIIAQYHQIIGNPALPPLWSLGWHASAYAYQNQSDVQENIDNYAKDNIPLEGIWLDIPYMDGYADFSVNTTAFPTLKQMTDTIHANNQRMIVILDAGISGMDAQNKYFSQAAQANVLLKSAINPDVDNGFLTNHVWPNKTVFLDFFAGAARDIWAQGINDLWAKVPFDGLWLDMNEATGFCNGECPTGIVPNYTTVGEVRKRFLEAYGESEVNHTWWTSYDTQDVISSYDLPFIPGGRWNLDNMSLSLNATHPSNGFTEYNVHNLFGHVEGMVTHEIMTNQTPGATPIPNTRSFLLSRSTFAGSGAYVQHWLGDNHRTWEDMKNSIAGVMNFNMFGIPMVGPDTCGFFGADGQDQLCGRWIQLATFYPFARQHRDISGGGDHNEPWALASPYKEMAINALYDRLQYSRLFYTCLFNIHHNGGSCYDPLFFHYPELEDAFQNIEHTFIFANSLKVTPVLTENATTVDSYFPNGDWISLQDWSVQSVSDPSGGKMVTLQAPLDTTTNINVHLMPGVIIPRQDNSEKKFKTTKDMIANGTIELIANRDANGHAEGFIMLDHGETRTELDNGLYEEYKFILNGKSLIKQNIFTPAQSSGLNLKTFIIGNAEDLKATDFACVTDSQMAVTQLTPTYDDKLKTLNFTNGTDQISFFNMQNLYFGTKGKDVNLCDASTNYYKIKDGNAPDLSGNTATTTLQSLTPDALRDLKITFSVLSTGNLNIHWTYDSSEGVKVPFEIPNLLIDVNRTDLLEGAKLSDWVTISSVSPIVIDIKSGAAGVSVYTINGFILAEYFNHIDAVAHTDKTIFKGLLGLFEQVASDFWLGNGIYSLWSRDAANPPQSTKLPASNLYGTHPFLMGKATDQSWFAVYTNLAAAQDWSINNDPTTGDVKVKTFATGGSGDLHFMFGATPSAVTQQYHKIVGKPVLTPQWALGWSQCKWGYHTLDEVKQVVANYTEFQLPLDTQWSDIDYLNNYQDFTFDPVNYKGLGDFVDYLHSQNKRYIPIIDAGVAARKGYQAYEDGLNQNVFIKTDAGDTFIGQVWPDDAAFPDWFSENTASWWGKQLSNFYDQVKFDGLWLDMNEASNFCNGVCYESQMAANPVKNKLPYIPTGRDLEMKSITLDAKHANGYTELDVHSLFGAMESAVTHQWFQNEKKSRTMIIERSAFAGMGKYASRWLGDNFSSQEYMGWSVTGIMSHNIAGIPLAGSDICGFIDNTTPELCARWYTLGAFYPFSRNHNNWGNAPQEPWVFKGIPYEATIDYFDIIQHSMRVKLNMIRYFYTELFTLSAVGGAFYKPMWFEFPNDAGAVNASPELNIMLGEAMKLSINSNKLGQNSTEFYMPAGLWCDVFNKNGTGGCLTFATGTNVNMSTKAYDFHLHLRAGFLVPMQDGVSLAENANVTSTFDLQSHPVDFHVLPTCNATNCVASGKYINDDGVNLDIDGNVNVYLLEYVQDVTTTTLNLTIVHHINATNMQDMHVNKNDALGMLQIYNAAAQNLNVAYTVQALMLDGTPKNLADATYDASSDRLVFTNSGDDLWLPQVDKLILTKKP